MWIRDRDKDASLACAKEFLDDQLRAARTFKVETKRADKTFPMTSIQLSQYVGGELLSLIHICSSLKSEE